MFIGRIMIFLSSILLISACNQNTKTEKVENPFLTEWKTPFGTPPFDEIKMIIIYRRIKKL